jgi:ATP-dependent Clp protease adaptor protein ClpS
MTEQGMGTMARRGRTGERGGHGAARVVPPGIADPRAPTMPVGVFRPRASAAPGEVRESDLQGLRERFPPYRVILHNDDHHSMDEVVLALIKSVPGLNERKAILIMLRAHLHGRATVIVCPREQAEYYAERIGTYGLTVTIERA